MTLSRKVGCFTLLKRTGFSAFDARQEFTPLPVSHELPWLFDFVGRIRRGNGATLFQHDLLLTTKRPRCVRYDATNEVLEALTTLVLLKSNSQPSEILLSLLDRPTVSHIAQHKCVKNLVLLIFRFVKQPHPVIDNSRCLKIDQYATKLTIDRFALRGQQ